MSKYLTVVSVAIVLLCVFAPAPAKADSTIDTFVWVPCTPNLPGYPSCGVLTSGPGELTWQAPSSPTPTSVCPGPIISCFTITSDITSNGIDHGPTAITFSYPFAGQPVIQLGGGDLGFGVGLLAGTETSPTFVTGEFILYQADTVSPQAGTLTITAATGVPEPSTLLLTAAGLLGGLAVIAFWRKESASATCP